VGARISGVPCAGLRDHDASSIRDAGSLDRLAGQDIHSGVAAIDRNDATTRMCASPAEKDAGHGRAGAQAVAPHVRRQAFALKNVAAGEPDFLFNVRRPKRFRIDHSGGNVAAEAGEGGESELPGRIAMVVPGAGPKLVGHVLREDTHDVRARRGDAWIVNALEVELGPEMFRQAPLTRRSVSLYPFMLCQWRVELPEVMRLRRAGTRIKIGQFTQPDVDFQSAAFDRHGLYL